MKVLRLITITQFIVIVVILFSLSIRDNRTTKMCTTETTQVYSRPTDRIQSFSIIYEGEPVWFSGTRLLNWLFVDFDQGSGWIRTQDFTDCPASPEQIPSDIVIGYIKSIFR